MFQRYFAITSYRVKFELCLFHITQLLILSRPHCNNVDQISKLPVTGQLQNEQGASTALSTSLGEKEEENSRNILSSSTVSETGSVTNTATRSGIIVRVT